MVPMSNNLFMLFFVWETCKQSSREDRWCLCQAACPRCFLFPKHINKAAGLTGGAHVKQLVLVVSCLRNMLRRGQVVPMSSKVVLVVSCFRNMETKQPGGLVVLMSRSLSSLFSREDRWCSCQATCPRCFLFPKHVNKAAGRTGCAYVKQFVLVVSCFRNM